MTKYLMSVFNSRQKIQVYDLYRQTQDCTCIMRLKRGKQQPCKNIWYMVPITSSVR